MPRLRVERTLVRGLRFATLPDCELGCGDLGLQGGAVVFMVVFLGG